MNVYLIELWGIDLEALRKFSISAIYQSIWQSVIVVSRVNPMAPRRPNGP